MSQGWRSYVEQDFFRDRIKVYVTYRDHEGLKALKSFPIELVEVPTDPAQLIPPEVEPIEIPREVAETLLEALARALVGGTGDLLDQIHRLQHELRKSEKRVDALINGIGRLGGVPDGD